MKVDEEMHVCWWQNVSDNTFIVLYIFSDINRYVTINANNFQKEKQWKPLQIKHADSAKVQFPIKRPSAQVKLQQAYEHRTTGDCVNIVRDEP